MELFASACVLSRIDYELTEAGLPSDEVNRRVQTALYFLATSARRVDDELQGLGNNDDSLLRAAAAIQA